MVKDFLISFSDNFKEKTKKNISWDIFIGVVNSKLIEDTNPNIEFEISATKNIVIVNEYGQQFKRACQ